MPVISTNLAANTAHRLVNINADKQSSSISKLASSSRIVKASDDAAGSAISTGMRADISTLMQAAENIAQAQAICQIVDSQLSGMIESEQRIKSLLVAANTSTVTDEEREYIDDEIFSNLYNEWRTCSKGLYLDIYLLDVHGIGNVMIGSDPSDTIELNFETWCNLLSPTSGDVQAAIYGNGYWAGDWAQVIGQIDDLLSTRASTGAMLSRLETHANFIANSIEKISDANSTIQDVDVASESAKLSAEQVKLQAGVAALASANLMPKALLKLLQ